MPNGKIKCPKCGAFYNVISSDLNEIQLMYHCEHCGTDFQIEFFDSCPNCHINIGFVEGGGFKSDMKHLANISSKSFFGGSIFSDMAKLAFAAGDNIIGKVKDPNGDGQCPICKKRYVRCPICNELTQIPQDANFTNNFVCKNCGQLVAAGKAPHNPTQHSKEFYKH